MIEVPFQPGLFDPSSASFDADFSRLERLQLDADCWIDLAPGWVQGDAALFAEIIRVRRFAQRSRWMYERRVLEPRLTSPWSLDSGEPLLPRLCDAMRLALSARYGVTFDSAGFNLYRDGRDGVAWHRDKIRREIAEPIVVLVSLGAPRRLLVRKRGGGPSRAFPMGPGDLLVTGGRTQREYEHTIPKVARAGPRLSIAFRHGMDARAYGREERG